MDKGQDPLTGFSKEDYKEARQTIVAVILGTGANTESRPHVLSKPLAPRILYLTNMFDAADMKFHFDHLNKFKTRVSTGAFDEPDRQDVRFLETLLLHAADVSNPAKPWHLSMEWTSRVMDEFFRQGDVEQASGLAISPFMDRSKTNIASCQAADTHCHAAPPRFDHAWNRILAPIWMLHLEHVDAQCQRATLHSVFQVGFINFLIKPYFLEWCQFLGDECLQQVFKNVENNVSKWETEGEGVLGDRLAKIKDPPAAVAPPPTVDPPAEDPPRVQQAT